MVNPVLHDLILDVRDKVSKALLEAYGWAEAQLPLNLGGIGKAMSNIALSKLVNHERLLLKPKNLPEKPRQIEHGRSHARPHVEKVIIPLGPL